MGLPLNAEMLRTAYDFLCTTPPFRRWNLPPSSEIRFKVSDHVRREGDCDKIDGRIVVRISRRTVSHTQNLLEAMAHEMIHVHEYQLGIRSHHGASFHMRARRVCHYHGFDPLGFF